MPCARCGLLRQFDGPDREWAPNERIASDDLARKTIAVSCVRPAVAPPRPTLESILIRTPRFSVTPTSSSAPELFWGTSRSPSIIGGSSLNDSKCAQKSGGARNRVLQRHQNGISGLSRVRAQGCSKRRRIARAEQSHKGFVLIHRLGPASGIVICNRTRAKDTRVQRRPDVEKHGIASQPRNL